MKLSHLFITIWIGRISFTSHTPGEHTICLYSNSSAWFSGSQLRVHMDIQVGEHAIDYAQVAQKEKMTELQLRIRQLLNQVDQITKEQNYQRVSQVFRHSYHRFQFYNFFKINFVHFSIARNGSDKPAKVQTNVYSGGHWLKLLFSFRWASGKCAIWRHSSKQRN